FSNSVTMAQPTSGSSLRSPRTTSSGSVSATTWLGRPNFGGRPRFVGDTCSRSSLAARLEADADANTGATHVDAPVLGENPSEPELEIGHQPLPQRPHRAGADN